MGRQQSRGTQGCLLPADGARTPGLPQVSGTCRAALPSISRGRDSPSPGVTSLPGTQELQACRGCTQATAAWEWDPGCRSKMVPAGQSEESSRVRVPLPGRCLGRQTLAPDLWGPHDHPQARPGHRRQWRSQASAEPRASVQPSRVSSCRRGHYLGSCCWNHITCPRTPAPLSSICTKEGDMERGDSGFQTARQGEQVSQSDQQV